MELLVQLVGISAVGLFLIANLVTHWSHARDEQYRRDVDENNEAVARSVDELVDTMGREGDDALASDVGAEDGAPRSRRSR